MRGVPSIWVTKLEYYFPIVAQRSSSRRQSARRGLSCVGEAMAKLLELFINVVFRQNQEQLQGRVTESEPNKVNRCCL